MHCARCRSFFSRSREAAAAGFALLSISLTAAGCAGGSQPPTSRPRTLSADSAALLAEALKHVQPAFATQAEALRAGAYAAAAPASQPAAPVLAVSPAPSFARGAYVIQIAAYRQREAARIAAAVVGEYFPELDVRVEEAGEHFRVALGAWAQPRDAQATLRAVQQRYPDAWLRRANP
jgi:hypothetical protein